MSSVEKRRHARTPFNEAVYVSWQDSDGLAHVVKGRALNCSRSGLGMEAKEAVETRTMVQVQSGGSRQLGLASVRYCARKGMRFVVGLEFTRGFRWQDVPALSGSG